MCFRPSPVKRNNNDETITCSTCGMPINPDEAKSNACPYCGDPIPSDPPNDFKDIDPSYSTRII
jgi:hypothetical protein